MSIIKNIFLLLVAFSGLYCTLYAQVNEKTLHSLKKMFGETVIVTSTAVILSAYEKKQIFEKAKTSWNKDTLPVFICSLPDKNIAGYGFVDDVKGKVQYITYLTGVKPNGEIADINVLSYREAYGGEIMYESFRKQFKNKTASDQLYPGKDIKNISGATISVRAITLGVKRVLTTFELVHKRIQ